MLFTEITAPTVTKVIIAKYAKKNSGESSQCLGIRRSRYRYHMLRRNASRTLSVLSLDTRGRPGLLPLHKHPASTNCRYHIVMLFLHGASFLNRARNSRYTVIIDLDTSKRSTQKAFSCCDAILQTGSTAPQ